jgi:hypothetical protein
MSTLLRQFFNTKRHIQNINPFKPIHRNFHSSSQRKGSSNYFAIGYGVPLFIDKYDNVSKNAIEIDRWQHPSNHVHIGNKPMVFGNEYLPIPSHGDHFIAFIPNIKVVTYFDRYLYLGKTIEKEGKLFDHTDEEKKKMLIELLKKSNIDHQKELSESDKKIIHDYYFTDYKEYIVNIDKFKKEHKTLEDYFGYYVHYVSS